MASPAQLLTLLLTGLQKLLDNGTNVFVFGGGGLIESVTGFWNPSGAK
jgi:hypothetical protein